MNGVELVEGDITLPDTLPKAFQGVDVIFNNAAIMEIWGTLSKFFPVNVEGTRHVLETARKLDIPKIVHTGSTAIHGFPNLKEPIGEEFPQNPFGNYQKSKWLGEQVVDEYVTDYGMDIASVRPPFILGARDQYATPIYVEMLQTRKMTIIGNGEQIQSIVHARDAAQCLRLAAESPHTRGEAFNVTSFNIAVKELFTKYAELLEVPPKFQHIPYRLAYTLGFIFGSWGKLTRKKDSPFITTFRVKLMGTNYIFDSTKAKEKLGYKPMFNADRTIKDSLLWYFSQHPNQSVPTPLQQ